MTVGGRRMIGEAALNGLFQWLPQGLFDIGKWGLGRRWNGNSMCSNKRKKGEEEEDWVKKRSKHCPSFSLKHKLVLEQSGSSMICAPLSRVEAAGDSTLESHPVFSFSIGVSSPLGKKTCSYASVKDPSPVQQEAPVAALKSCAKDVSAMCSYGCPQLPAATTTTATAFFDPICSLFDDSDDDEALSAAVTTASSIDHPPLKALKGQVKLVLDKGPKMITSQDQSTMAQLYEAIERHQDYSTADHGAMWTLRHLAKSFADILELSNSCRKLAEAEAKYAQAKAELGAKKARARESHAAIDQRQGVVEKLNSEATRLREQLAATEAKMEELENEVKMEKESDAELLQSIQATSNSCKKARTERGRLQRENCDLNKKLAEVDAAVAFLHPWLSL